MQRLSYFSVTDAGRTLANAAKQAAYLTHRLGDVDSLRAGVAARTSQLRAAALSARHAAASVGISITGKEGEGGCARTYRVNKTASIR